MLCMQCLRAWYYTPAVASTSLSTLRAPAARGVPGVSATSSSDVACPEVCIVVIVVVVVVVGVAIRLSSAALELSARRNEQTLRKCK
jgi:hypothetical protein